MKNTTQGHTESFIRMRQMELDFIKSSPYYGDPLAKDLYDKLKSKVNILQVGICGAIVSVVSYKKDAELILAVLNRSFPERRVLQKTSELTELITTYTLPA
jgi:hypothetical protein